MLDREPAAQAPAGIGLVAEEEFHNALELPKSVRIERSRDAPRPCAPTMGVSTSLDTNGRGVKLLGSPLHRLQHSPPQFGDPPALFAARRDHLRIVRKRVR